MDNLKYVSGYSRLEKQRGKHGAAAVSWAAGTGSRAEKPEPPAALQEGGPVGPTAERGTGCASLSPAEASLPWPFCSGKLFSFP